MLWEHVAYLPAYAQCANLNDQASDIRVEFSGISKSLSPWWLSWLWRWWCVNCWCCQTVTAGTVNIFIESIRSVLHRTAPDLNILRNLGAGVCDNVLIVTDTGPGITGTSLRINYCWENLLFVCGTDPNTDPVSTSVMTLNIEFNEFYSINIIWSIVPGCWVTVVNISVYWYPLSPLRTNRNKNYLQLHSSVVPQIDPSVPQPVVQSRRRPLLGPFPDWKRLLPLSHLRHYAKRALKPRSLNVKLGPGQR